MAKLDDVAKDLNVKLNIKQQTAASHEKVSGHKRRSWLEQDDINTPSTEASVLHKPQADSGLDQFTNNNKVVANREQTDSKQVANR